MRRPGSSVVLVVVMALAGCSSSKPTTAPTAGGSSTARASGGEAAARWSALVARVPASDGTPTRVWIVDIARARQLLGIPRPAAGSADDVLAKDQTALSRAGAASPSRVMAPRASAQQSVVRGEIGFSAVDIDRVVQAGEVPATMEVIEGSIDAATVAKAARADAVWGASLQSVRYHDIDYLSWGDDGTFDAKKATVLRPVGESLRLLASSGRALLAQRTDDMQKLLDVPKGGAPPVTSDASIASVLARFEREPLYAAFVGRPSSPGPTGPTRSSLPTAVSTFGSAVGQDGQGAFLLLVFPSSDAAAAAAKKDALEKHLAEGRSLRTNQAWKELFTSTEVTVDGSLVVARLRVEPARAGMWSQLVVAGESIVQIGAS
jgi:hypothetical protein